MIKKKICLNNIIIAAIVVIKIILMGMFSSDYQDKMFLPFVNSFLDGNNPYEFYYKNNLISSFPYFPFMLMVESIGGGVIRLFAVHNIFLRNIIFKLPLLAFDLIGFCVIRKMDISWKRATLFYFCSPIIIYATYIHSQLDIIPTILLLVAIYYLLNWKKKYNLWLYALFLGLSIGTKTHIIAAVPILFFYIAQKKNYYAAFKYHLIASVVTILLVIPFWSEGFFYTVLLNKEQSAIFSVGVNYGYTQIFIPIVVLILLYINVFELNYFNRNLLISMLTLLFSIFLIFMAPMPAWFVWIAPLMAVSCGYISKNRYTGLLAYGILNVIYIIYFVFLHQTDYADIIILGNSAQGIKIGDLRIKYIVFSALVAVLIVILYRVYTFGIASNSLYKRRNIPFSIGIAGDSGSGKSILLEMLERLFNSEKDLLLIEGDGDHRWVRNDENWEKYTALNPKANYLYRQASDIHSLKNGKSINRVDYDHNQGLFSDVKKIQPKKYMILCGLHSLYLPQLRKDLDLKIYMNTDDKLRKYWKIQRDTSKRGYSKQDIVEQIEKRIPDAEKYIYPQKQYADIVITYFDKTLVDCFADKHILKLSVQFDLDIEVDVAEIIECFMNFGVEIEHIIHEDLNHQTLVFDGEQLVGCSVDYEKMIEQCIPQLEDFFTYRSQWGENIEGVVQFMLLFMISIKMKGDS